MGEIAVFFFECNKNPTKKMLCTYHGDSQRPKFLLRSYDLMMRCFLRRCDAVVVSSPRLLTNSRVLDSVRGKAVIIPLGIQTECYEKIYPRDLKEAARLLPSIPGSFKVMYAGRMVYYKGIEVLLDALQRLKAQSCSISAFLVGSGPLENDVKASIAKNGLEDNVTVLPPQPENIYRALFHLADCFVLPSTHRTEAYGIVLLEAMASGLPIVSTELGTGTSWLNRDGETGIVVRPGDPEALAEAIKYLAQHGEERAKMASAALVRAKEFFEEDKMLKTYEELYNER
jgi:rhamnosyl/mannosyltransferase